MTQQIPYVPIDGSDIRISRFVLGGHEYLPDGRSRGFNEDFARATTSGYLFPGFGADRRKSVLRAAYELGINAFDVTLDSEKEALGRNLAELPPPYEVYVQTRPEGMAYGYDPGNRKMLDLALLRAEVLRILGLLRRERIDFLNLGILKCALDDDPDFLAQLRANVDALKKEGLIRMACADTFSGEQTYLAQIDSGAFEVLNVNFNLADDGARHAVLPAARRSGLAVIAREAYIKGQWFRLGHAAGILDDEVLARSAMKWVLSQQDVDAIIIGAGTPEQLMTAAKALSEPSLSPSEESARARVLANDEFRAFAATRRAEFGRAGTD
jgi:aryl-alcohol dehydrogenase-like predicted oxidoreductase